LLIGLDRSAPMLGLARRRVARLHPSRRPILIRGDIRTIPLRTASVELVIAPYGILQSLIRKPDLSRTLAEAARVLRPGGRFIADLVPDLPTWEPYERQIRLHGRHGNGQVTLVESVRQDRRRGLTTFDEEFVEAGPRRGADSSRSVRIAARFSLTFRTVSMTETRRRLERTGFRVERLLGGYRGQRWTSASETWLIVARKR
jgi:SAM-dependent methyltransferase